MIYAISDLHGSYKALEGVTAFLNNEKVDLNKDKLLLLGDYIDRGPDSLKVLEKIISLQEKFGERNIIALKGNHEELFLAWLKNPVNTLTLNNGGIQTVASFLQGDLGKIYYDGIGNLLDQDYNKVNNEIVDYINEEYKDIINWIENLPYYHEEKNTLFVHAGFNEFPSRHWSESSTDDMTWMFPAQYGYTPWNKVVVAGHIMTRELHPEYTSQELKDSIYRNKDHIYIDGAAFINEKANILEVDDQKREYYDAWTGQIIPE